MPMMKAIDVKPGRWAVMSKFEGGQPFVNELCLRKWSDDGETIWFMLESHNFLQAKPDEEIDVVPYTPKYRPEERQAQMDADDEKLMANRPSKAVPMVPCPTCGTLRAGERQGKAK